MFTIAFLIITLQAFVIAYMGWDHSYGCFTRSSFNLMYPVLKALGYKFILGDVDKFKQHNTEKGHEEVNRMVYRSIRTFWGKRRIGDIVFRLYSGDEFAIATKGDTVKIINRLSASFKQEGMSLTLTIMKGDIDTSMLKVLTDKKAQ